MLYYDRAGVEITFDEWMHLMENQLYRWVAVSEIGPYTISTIWMGLDHNFAMIGPPQIFETLVFSEVENEIDGRRYATEDEARAGHFEYVTLIRAVV